MNICGRRRRRRRRNVGSLSLAFSTKVEGSTITIWTLVPYKKLSPEEKCDRNLFAIERQIIFAPSLSPNVRYTLPKCMRALEVQEGIHFSVGTKYCIVLRIRKQYYYCCWFYHKYGQRKITQILNIPLKKWHHSYC